MIVNEQKDKELALTRQIKHIITSSGGTCSYMLNKRVGQEAYLHLYEKDIPAKTECILVLGGDGTLIRAARDMVQKNIPLLGINMGHTGYLCEVESSTVPLALDQLKEDNYTVENRMLLHGYSDCIPERNYQVQISQLAFNDVVIRRSGLPQMVNLTIYVNGEYLNTYSADGMIIATPTGSTAYSMSAGGPIVDPMANLILITPISPHSLISKSIVLAADAQIVVEIGSRRMERDEEVDVSFDGDKGLKLAVGDKIVISRAKVSAKILKLSKLSFFEVLRKKMQGY